MAVHPVRSVFIDTPSPQKPVFADVITLLVKNMMLVLPTVSDLANRQLPDTVAVYIESEGSVYAYDPNDTTSAADGHFILIDGTPTTPRRYKLQGFTTNLTFFTGVAAASISPTIPLAIGFLNTAQRAICRLNLTPYRKVRMHVLMTGAAPNATTVLILRYVTAAFGYSTTIADYLSLGSSEVQVPLNVVGFTSSAWISLAPGAVTDCFLAVMGFSPAGATAVTFTQIWAEFSS